MIYPFRCPKCNHYDEVWRPHAESSLPLNCTKCGEAMYRIYGGHGVKCENKEVWNPGLGCRQGEVKEKLKRLKSEKGVELHEVGNERSELKVKHNDYKMSERDNYEISQILKGS